MPVFAGRALIFTDLVPMEVLIEESMTSRTQQAGTSVNEKPEAVRQPDSMQEDAIAAGGLAAATAEIEENADESAAVDEQPVVPQKQHYDLPKQLTRAVDIRLTLWKQLLKLEKQRNKLSTLPGNADTRSEVSRQQRELNRIPTGENLQKSLEQLTKKHGQLVDASTGESASSSDEDSAEQAAAKAEEEEKAAKGLYRTLLEMGIKQIRLLAARNQLDDIVPRTAESLSTEELLCKLTAHHGVDAQTLVGWTFYALGLEQRIDRCKSLEEEYHARLAEAETQRKNTRGGLLSRFRREPRSEDAEFPPLDPDIEATRLAAGRELKAVELLLSELFWKLYEEVAWLYAGGKLGQSDEPYARALLRYGMVAVHPGLIAPGKSEFIIRDCTEDVYQWRNTMEETYVVYADEHIRAIYNEQSTVSPDEQLELNERGSEQWKADRVWRQAVFICTKTELYEYKVRELSLKIEEVKEKCTKLEEQFNELKEQGKKTEAAAARRELLDTRPVIARLEQMLERLNTKFIPGMKEAVVAAQAKMNEAKRILSPEEVVRREARLIQRLARLAARLKTPYQHFVLRDFFEPDSSNYNNRKAVRRAIQRVEYADHYLFHHIVIPNKKRDRQLTVRLSPRMLIIPARGAMSISINARQSNDAGNLMVPLLGQRKGMLNTMVTETLADFGWDCSLEEAGADWITAGALCSAYANVRWSYRSKTPKAQKKAGFDKKKKDRQDWRGHYALYVDSAEQAGRKLFYKCQEVYEAVVKHIGLPDNQERLRRD